MRSVHIGHGPMEKIVNWNNNLILNEDRVSKNMNDFLKVVTNWTITIEGSQNLQVKQILLSQILKNI